MSELTMLALPEQITAEEKHLIATYYLETGVETDIVKKLSAIAVEQTTGTWVPVPEETPAMREQHVAKVVGIYEVPGYEFELPARLESRRFVFQLAFPTVNFGPQIPMLLSTVIGNISMSGKLKLLDLQFPQSYLDSFPGPKFGTEGIRDLLGVHDRPLLNNMIKPCTGYTPEVGAKLFGEAIRGGVDIVKDDELIADPSFCPLVERVKLYMAAAKQHYEQTGNRVLYTANITDRVDKIKDNAYRALDAGANALMINYLTVGISALRALAEDPGIAVPILAHLDFAGTMYESPYSGISSHLILGKLARLAGADIVVYPSPSPFGKFPFLKERYLQIGHHLLGKWLHFKPVFPMPGGGIMPAVVPFIINTLGTDCILGAGGAIHGHPMGPVAGGKAMRQAIDAVLAGITLEEAGKQHPELQSAIEAWGLIEDEKQVLFDIQK
ncbi:MAG: ribulose 1,5-bisphosphate carboxylase [Firmicutes bacterium]|nr:ribulose 1,5-bisphosphate carboxylase [Bacillota bacterium]